MATATYHVTPTTDRVPAARFVAGDLIELADQVANHYAKHKHLRRGVEYHASMTDAAGQITQRGLLRPLTFTIRKD